MGNRKKVAPKGSRTLPGLPVLKFPRKIKKPKMGIAMEKIEKNIVDLKSKRAKTEPSRGMFHYYSQGNLHTVTSM